MSHYRSFDLAGVLGGRMALDLERMKRGKNVYYEILEDAKPGGKEFWWFGNRPYRYRGWDGSYDQAESFEEDAGAVYSIHSPDQVNALSGELANLSKASQEIESEELRDLLADYEHCIGNVQKKGAGTFVENDT